MRKKIVKIGTGAGIYFNKEEREIFRITPGGIIDISDIVVRPKRCLKRRKKKSK